MIAKTIQWSNYINKGLKEVLHLNRYIGGPRTWWTNDNISSWYVNEKSELNILDIPRIAALPSSSIAFIRQSREFFFKSFDKGMYSRLERQSFELEAERYLMKVNKSIREDFPSYKFITPFETFGVYLSTPAKTVFKRYDNFFPLNIIITWGEFMFNRFVLLLGYIGGVLFIIKGTNRMFKLFFWTQLFLLVFFSLELVTEEREVYIPAVLALLPAGMFLYELLKGKRYLILLLLLILAGVPAYFETISLY